MLVLLCLDMLNGRVDICNEKRREMETTSNTKLSYYLLQRAAHVGIGAGIFHDDLATSQTSPVTPLFKIVHMTLKTKSENYRNILATSGKITLPSIISVTHYFISSICISIEVCLTDININIDLTIS